MKTKKKKWIILGSIISFFIILAIFNSDINPFRRKELTPVQKKSYARHRKIAVEKYKKWLKTVPMTGRHAISSSKPILTEKKKRFALALNSIMAQPNVIDAAVAQNNKTISLSLIVKNGTSKSNAKELGENFIRLVKTHSKDNAPGKEIGSGIYDYLIGVYYQNNKEIVMGAKASIARKITW